MSAIKVREKSVRNTFNNNNVELTVVEPTKLLFKVVVNTYKEIAKVLEMQNSDNDGRIINIQLGLPPQPKAYLKFPTYDWF